MNKEVSATLVITNSEADKFSNVPRVWDFKTRLTREEFEKAVDETFVEVVRSGPNDWKYEDIYEALLRRNDIEKGEEGYLVNLSL